MKPIVKVPLTLAAITASIMVITIGQDWALGLTGGQAANRMEARQAHTTLAPPPNLMVNGDGLRPRHEP